ncbi:MAG: OmpA family protein [Alistipes sp.]|nr:OmpA family protein [Alistipes sp.]
MMKRLFLTVCAAMMACTVTFAQEAQVEKRVNPWNGCYTNKFSHNWEVSAGVGISHLDVATHSKDAGKFFHRNSWNLNVGATKWIVPALGVRLQLEGGHFQNYSFVTDAHGEGAFQTPYVYLHADAMINLSNWIGGYKENRLYYAVPYVGFGYTAMSWTKKTPGALNNELAATAGLLNKFRVTDYLDVQLDLRLWCFAEDHLPAEVNGGGRYATSLTASVGAAYRFNKRDWQPIEYTATEVDGYLNEIEKLRGKVDEADDAIKSVSGKIADLEDENKRLKAKTQAVGESIVSAHTVVFFAKNEYELSQFAKATVDKYVQSVKDSDSKIVLVGHADNTTGSQEYNDDISKKRAEAVKAYMMEKGIDEARFDVQWVGASEEAFVEGDAEINRCVVIM